MKVSVEVSITVAKSKSIALSKLCTVGVHAWFESKNYNKVVLKFILSIYFLKLLKKHKIDLYIYVKKRTICCVFMLIAFVSIHYYTEIHAFQGMNTFCVN